MMLLSTPTSLSFRSIFILCRLVIVGRILFLKLHFQVHVRQFVLNKLVSVLLVPGLGIYYTLAALFLSYTPVFLGITLSNVVWVAD